jgi:hypothetical protein
MNKRSAVIVSASLILILIAGAYALSVELTRSATPSRTRHVATKTPTTKPHKSAAPTGGH